MINRGIPVRDYLYWHPFRLGLRIYLIVDIRNIAHVNHIFIMASQNPEEQIIHNGRSRVTDVRRVIYRRPTRIHRDSISIEWYENFFGARKRVI